MTTQLYARLECVKKEHGYDLVKEPLIDHLVDTAVAACILAKRFSVDETLATLAAAIHDIGKVLHNLINRRKIEEITGVRGNECRAAWRLSFMYHEILSTAVYGYYAWFHTSGDQGYENEIVSRAILLHHQGLRGLETSTYLDGLAWISSRIANMEKNDREALIEAFRDVTRSVAKRIAGCEIDEQLRQCCKPCQNTLNTVAEKLQDLADALEHTNIQSILEHASTLLQHWIYVPENQATKARSISGVLMLADNAIAKIHCGKESATRLYPKEAQYLLLRSRKIKCQITKQHAQETYNHLHHPSQ